MPPTLKLVTGKRTPEEFYVDELRNEDHARDRIIDDSVFMRYTPSMDIRSPARSPTAPRRGFHGR